LRRETIVLSADSLETLTQSDKALLAEAVLIGGGLPEEARNCLFMAADCYADSQEAEAYLRAAQNIAPDHAAVLIGWYRYYFYKGRLLECLGIAKQCLTKAARENGLSADWRQVAPDDAEFGRYEEVLPRFYLFVLKGYAYLHMRLGNLEEGRAAVMKLLELDPTDKVGAKVLLGVLERIGHDDYAE
jgi:tetratricopeptide (TPR) repeat protein